MKTLTEEQVLGLRLNAFSNIWTTGLLELDLDESYKTPFGVLRCTPGTGWFFSRLSNSTSHSINGIQSFSYTCLLTDFLKERNIKYEFDCPILKKLNKKRTHGIIFKILGYPHDTKCWF